MAITLAELRTQSRQRADMENSNFVANSELNSYINNSIAELHDLLSEAYGAEYFVKSTEVSIVVNQPNIALPADFYELKGVDIKQNSGDTYLNVKPFNFNERNRFTNFGTWEFYKHSNVRYRLVGNNLMLTPTPDSTGTIRIWYVPIATKLVLDSDSLNDFNAYSEYVIVDAAIKMMQKEESDVSVLMAQKQMLVDRIRGKAAQRDAANPGSVSDIYADNDDYFWRR